MHFRGKMRNVNLLFALIFCYSFFLKCSAADQRTVNVNFEGAEAMCQVFTAIHDKNPIEKIEKLLDKALMLESYKKCEEIHMGKAYKGNQKINLIQYKRFILDLAAGKIDTQGNARLKLIAPYIQDVVKYPARYSSAVKILSKTPYSDFLKARARALAWLPDNAKIENINVWVLFDIGGGSRINGNDIFYDLPFLLGKNGKFNLNSFLLTLSHEFYHFGDNSLKKEQVTAGSFNKNTPVYFYYKFISDVVTEGLPMCLCNNMDGLLFTKTYPKERVNETEGSETETWNYFKRNSREIFKHATDELENILNGKYKTEETYEKSISSYWYWYSGEYAPGKKFLFDRYYYLGTEIVGVIREAFGKKGIDELVLNKGKAPILFNQALEKLKPENYKNYLFPKDIIKKVNSFEILKNPK